MASDTNRPTLHVTRSTLPGRGWYAIVVCGDRGHHPSPTRTPCRTATELQAAVSRYIHRYPGVGAVAALLDMRALVFGPYANRAAARAASPSDPVGRVELFEDITI